MNNKVKNNLKEYKKMVIKREDYIILESEEHLIKNLIKYLEDEIKEHQILMNSNEIEAVQITELIRIQTYQDILERLKSGKYE